MMKKQAAGQPLAYSYIRFSTAEQIHGDSERRQVEAADQWAKANGFAPQTMFDRGLSAYSGEARKRGALGTFLRAVEEGAIPSGSVLIIESLDRFSRESEHATLALLFPLLAAGVSIHILSHNRTYSGNLGVPELMMLIMESSRAHNESAVKSQRLASVWAQKKQRARTGSVATKVLPYGYKFDSESMAVVAEPRESEAVRLIFELASEGVSRFGIVKRLNQSEYLPRRGGVWSGSTVRNTLRNRAYAYGDYQPYSGGNGKPRVKDGEPIPGYYPALVSPETFDKVQALMDSRQIEVIPHIGGTGNLMTGKLFCGRCGATMAVVNKGRKKPTHVESISYVCRNAQRGAGCRYHGIKRDIVEIVLLVSIQEFLNAPELFEALPGKPALAKEIAGLKAEIKGAEKALRKMEDNILSAPKGTVTDRLWARFSEEQNRVDGIRAELTLKLEEQKATELQASGYVSAKADFVALAATVLGFGKPFAPPSDDIRLRLKQAIQGLIERIDMDITKPALLIHYRTGFQQVADLPRQ